MDVGGTELNAVKTVERLDRARFEVEVACLRPDGPLRRRYEAAGIPVHEFPLTDFYGPRAIRHGLRFVRYLAARRVDIVHCHDFYSNIFGVFWARAARVPVIISSRRLWYDLPVLKLRAANRLAFQLSHCVLANSRSVGESLRDAQHVAPQRVAVIPNFIDEGAFAPLPQAVRDALLHELSIPAGSIVVGSVGRLIPVKDQASLVRATAQLKSRWPQLRVVLVGDGETRQALEALVRELGLEREVRFAGMRPNEPNIQHLFDISVLPSLSEGFPNVIVEAMAAGVPVVATDVGGSRDAVREGETGFLVPPGDPGRLAAAVERLLEDPSLRARMGNAACLIAREAFHASSVLPLLESLYERLARRVDDGRGVPPVSVPTGASPLPERVA